MINITFTWAQFGLMCAMMIFSFALGYAMRVLRDLEKEDENND